MHPSRFLLTVLFWSISLVSVLSFSDSQDYLGHQKYIRAEIYYEMPKREIENKVLTKRVPPQWIVNDKVDDWHETAAGERKKTAELKQISKDGTPPQKALINIQAANAVEPALHAYERAMQKSFKQRSKYHAARLRRVNRAEEAARLTKAAKEVTKAKGKHHAVLRAINKKNGNPSHGQLRDELAKAEQKSRRPNPPALPSIPEGRPLPMIGAHSGDGSGPLPSR